MTKAQLGIIRSVVEVFLLPDASAELLQKVCTGVAEDVEGRGRRASLLCDLHLGMAKVDENFSYQKAELCVRTAVYLALGHRRWLSRQNPELMDSWPASELILLSNSAEFINWQERWQTCGGNLSNGKMIALNSDPIWKAISFLRLPFPPFDVGSGMDVRNINWKNAEDVGLVISAKNNPTVSAWDFLNAEVEIINKDSKAALKERIEVYFQNNPVPKEEEEQ